MATETTSVMDSHSSVSSSLSFVQRQILAGAMGSIATTIILNPVGVIKVRTQAGQGGILAVTKQVIANEGFRGFWMGSGLGLVQSMPSTVIYMTSYENIKGTLTKLVEDRGYPGGGSGMFMGAIPGIAGAIARSLVVTILAPLELVRTRTLAGLGSNNVATTTATSISSKSQSQSVWSLIKTIHRTEGGISAFYRGLGSTIMRDTPFSAMYWMTFEAVKNNVYSHLLVHEDARESTSVEHATVNFLSGSTSGTLAAILTHPFDVLKTQSQLAAVSGTTTTTTTVSSAPPIVCARQVCRIMAECCCPCTSSVTAATADAAASTDSSRLPTSTTVSTTSSTSTTTTTAPLSMRQGLAQIIRSRGLVGLFSGLSMRLATIIPGSGIMITVYEFAKTFDLKI